VFVLHTHPFRGESHIHHNAERLQHLQQGWARLSEILRVKDKNKMQTEKT